MGNKRILVATIGAMAIAFGCSGASTGSKTAYSLDQFEYPLTSTDVATGEAVYAEYCEGCHPGGEKGDGPKISGKGLSPAKMRWQIRAGGDDMPAFGPDKISKEKLDAVLAYTETFGALAR